MAQHVLAFFPQNIVLEMVHPRKKKKKKKNNNNNINNHNHNQ